MNYKLVASQNAGKYQKGQEITNPEEIAAALASNLRKRFVKVPLHPGEAIEESEGEPAPAEAAGE